MKKFFGFILVIAIIGIAVYSCGMPDTDKLKESGQNLVDSGMEFLDNTLYDVDELDVFNSDYEILSGDIEKTQIGEETPSDICVILGGGTIEVVASDDSFCHVSGVGVEKMQCYLENGTVYVHALRNSSITDEMKIYVYVPSNVIYNNAVFNLGAGYLKIDNIVANQIGLDVGAGSLEGNVLPMNFMETNCDMGNIEVTVGSNKEAYNYVVSVTAGQASIDDEVYSIAKRKTIDNDSDKTIEVDVTMGNISLLFAQ